MREIAPHSYEKASERTDAALRALVCLLARQAAQETIAKTPSLSAEEGEPGDNAGQTNG